MVMSVLTGPDILVLGGGGVLGEAWMTGLLAGLEDASGAKLSRCDHYVGTSAGSIVAARLAAGQPLRRPETDPSLLPALPEVRFRRSMPALVATASQPVKTVASTVLAPISSAVFSLSSPVASLALSITAPFASAALGITTPAGALARIAALKALPRATGSLADLRAHFEALELQFDGRLMVTAVDRASGRRVLFGAPGAPIATVAEAVHASCTVPWMFPAVSIGGAHYVDGGFWSPTNLDAAPVLRGSRVLCLNPTAGLRGPHPILTVARGASRSAMALEATALRGRGADVTAVGPSPEAAALMGSNLMARGPRREVLAAGYRQGLELTATRP
jgi:NTE family protein